MKQKLLHARCAFKNTVIVHFSMCTAEGRLDLCFVVKYVKKLFEVRKLPPQEDLI